MQPMLATRGDRVPSGTSWKHEVKWDGMRTLAAVSAAGVRVFSRNERDVSASFPELSRLDLRGHSVVLDGEVVCFVDGRPSFGSLAGRMHVTDARRAAALATSSPVTLLVFDLLELDGESLLERPLRERRARLLELQLGDAVVQVPPAYDDGETLLAAAEQQGLEGVVSKRLDSPYRPGRRSRDWLKFPIRPTGSFVVGGYRHETGSDRRLGAVLVGEPTAAGLRYRGRVGSGLAGRAGGRLLEALLGLRIDDCPFVDEVPRVDREGTVWVRPEVIVDLEYLMLTGEGRLRQPAYRGQRSDLSMADIFTSSGGPG